MRMGSASGMVALAASAWMTTVERRRTVEVIPGTAIKLWNECQLRVMILLSLFIQILLVFLATRRKTMVSSWVRIAVWVSYLSADWAATVCLGIISSSHSGESTSSDPYTVISAFWAPFLLLHLGGPDNITAYSLEDNELWLRHLLGLTVTAGGLIKYGERTASLRSARKNYFKESNRVYSFWPKNDVPSDPIYKNAQMLFRILQTYYADLPLSYGEIMSTLVMFSYGSHPLDAFRLVEIELAYLHDKLYTKSAIQASTFGVILRLITFVCSTTVLLLFWLIVDKHTFSIIDVVITYILLVCAVGFDVSGAFTFFFSDWRMLICPTGCCTDALNRAVTTYISKKKRWSGVMGQYSLIGASIKYRSFKCHGMLTVLGVDETLEDYKYTTWKPVDSDVKLFIHKIIREKRIKAGVDKEECSKILKDRGAYVLGKKLECLEKLGWSVDENDASFEESLVMWHIATDVCFYVDQEEHCSDQTLGSSDSRGVAKSLSDYMFYLRTSCPFMLPTETGKETFLATKEEANMFFHSGQLIPAARMTMSEAARRLFKGIIDELGGFRDRPGRREASVLKYGSRLAYAIQSLVTEEILSDSETWEMISGVWVSMLCYAANECSWDQHAQQLRRGGELITHVKVLMANYGMSPQFSVHGWDRRRWPGYEGSVPTTEAEHQPVNRRGFLEERILQFLDSWPDVDVVDNEYNRPHVDAVDDEYNRPHVDVVDDEYNRPYVDVVDDEYIGPNTADF